MAATKTNQAPPRQAPKAKGGDAKPAGGDGSKQRAQRSGSSS